MQPIKLTLVPKKTEPADPNTLNRRYKDLILNAFDDMEHRDARAFREKRAAVERAGRRRI